MPIKYKNLKALKAAYDSGELSRSYRLTMDNDHASVYVSEKKVFYSDCPPAADLLEEALTMLGIPFENA